MEEDAGGQNWPLPPLVQKIHTKLLTVPLVDSRKIRPLLIIDEADHRARGALIAAAAERCQIVSAEHFRIASTELI